MKKMNKFLLLLSLPVLGISATGCQATRAVINGLSISYGDALKYAETYFDPNALDSVDCSYTLNINSFNVDLNVSRLDSLGFTDEAKFGMGLNGISATSNNNSSYCLSSTMVSKIQQTYSNVSTFTLEKFTDVPLELNYSVINKGLIISLSSHGISDPVIKLLRTAIGALNIDLIRDELLHSESSSDEPYPSYVVYDTTSALIEQTFASADKYSSSIKRPKQHTKSYVQYLDLLFSFYDVSLDASSVTANDEVLFSIGTNGLGYENYSRLYFNSDLNIVLLLSKKTVLSSYVYSYYPKTLVDNFMSFHLDGRYEIKGNINIDIDLGSNL